MRINKVLIGAVAPFTAAALFAPGQAAAQQSASAAAMLEEVVVTARRREESLQDLPMAVQAITADAMQAQGIYNIQQITDFAPNVVLQEDQRQNDTRFYVRGIGGGFSNPAQIFGVGMYVDGHYMSGSLGAFMSTIDLDRVEVLRGPQGTLFGKNTTGGALSLVTAKPGPDFDSYVTLRAASYGEVGFRGMLNLPITDNLFFRGNYATESTDGFYTNKRTGGDMGGTDQDSYGLALRWEATDNWTIDAKVLASYDRDDNQGGQCVARPDQQLYGMLTRTFDRDGNPFADAAGPAFAGPDLISGTADDVIYTGPAPVGDGFDLDDWGSANDHAPYRTANMVGGSDMRPDGLYPGASAAWLNSCAEDVASGSVYNSYQDAIPHSYVDNEMFILDATWNSDGAIGPFEAANVQIKTAFRDTNYNYWQDRDFGPGIIDHIGNIPVKSSSAGVFRETDEFEVIFNGQIGDRVNLTAGVYYFDDLAGSGDQSCVNNWRAAFDPNDKVVPDQPGPDGILGNDDDIVTVGSINGLADDDVTCGGNGSGTFFQRLPTTWNPAGEESTSVRRSFWNANLVGGESTAVYAHVDFAINDAWSLAVGLRAMEDDRTLVNVEPGGTGAVTNCSSGLPGSSGYLTPCPDPVFTMNRSTLINGGFVGDSAASYSNTTGTISLVRQLTPGDIIDSGIVYGTISEGYLTGAFNDELNPYNIDFSRAGQELVQSLLAFGPEYVTNYEIGYKATMFDGNLRIAADYFIMDYTDKQEQITIDNPEGLYGPDPNLSYAANAASVDVSGIELELRAQPWDGGFLSIDAGILDFEYADFSYVDFTSGELVTPALTAIQNRTPDWSLTATVEHAFLLSNGGTVTPQLGLYAQAGMEWWPGLAEGEKSPICHQDQLSKWRLRVAYEPPAGNWQAALFGYNITDEEILFRCQENRHGVYTRFYERPAAWGAEFTYRFGDN